MLTQVICVQGPVDPPEAAPAPLGFSKQGRVVFFKILYI